MPYSKRICDPFCGQGTTLHVAESLGADSVGVAALAAPLLPLRHPWPDTHQSAWRCLRGSCSHSPRICGASAPPHFKNYQKCEDAEKNCSDSVAYIPTLSHSHKESAKRPNREWNEKATSTLFDSCSYCRIRVCYFAKPKEQRAL